MNSPSFVTVLGITLKTAAARPVVLHTPCSARREMASTSPDAPSSAN